MPILAENYGIFNIPGAIERSATGDGIIYCRASGGGPSTPARTNLLIGQKAICKAAMEEGGSRVLWTVGRRKQQCGRLETDQDTLKLAGRLAMEHGAWLCCRDIERLFHPAEYHHKTNCFAPYTEQDFEQLRKIVPLEIPIGLVIPPETPLEQLHGTVIRLGQHRGKLEGRFPGRPRKGSWQQMDLFG